MAKIKNWEKKTKYLWMNSKNPKKKVIIDDIGYNRYIVQNEKGFNAQGLIAIERSLVKATKRASAYMRSHPNG
jgi:hypothetical protein